MPDDTRKKTKKKSAKKAAIICAGVFICFLVLYLAGVIYPLLGIDGAEVLGTGLLAFYGLIIFVIIIGILIALRSRLKELEGGEEDEARKY